MRGENIGQFDIILEVAAALGMAETGRIQSPLVGDGQRIAARIGGLSMTSSAVNQSVVVRRRLRDIGEQGQARHRCPSPAAPESAATQFFRHCVSM
ncbi:MAG: hypothetical protein H6891_11505 [Brucellaceae bacterium]|nr:hypothetical protein [Brucellaceae bacterium]